MVPLRDEMYTDDAGVWKRGEKGARLVITWEDIWCAGGVVVDGITELSWFLELDWSYGEYAEFIHTMGGFSQAVREIGMRLAGESDWEERLKRLTPKGEKVVELWRRDGGKLEREVK